MAIAPNNPPNQITEVNAAIPSYLVANGAAVSSVNPLPTSSGGASTFPITTLYQVTTTFVDANGTCTIGDILQNIAVYNATGTVILDLWVNTTATFTLAAPPPSADVTPYIAGGGATAANQTTQIGLATTSDATLTAISGQLPALLGAQLPTDSLSVVVSNPTAGDVTVQFTYTVIAAFTGASVGDLLVRQDILDPTVVPPTVISETWYNATTGATLAGAPSYADLSSSAGSFTPVLPQYTVANLTTSTSGTVAAGCFQISFANAGTADAVVAGQTLPAGAALSYNAPSGGTIGAVTYDGTGTTLLIATLV